MKKVRPCMICRAPTVADNKLCKRVECHIERQKRRIIPISSDDDIPPSRSGNYMSLKNCTHGISLEGECSACEKEWKDVMFDTDELPSNPRIRIK